MSPSPASTTLPMEALATCRLCGEPLSFTLLGGVCPACLLMPALQELDELDENAPVIEQQGDRIGRYMLLDCLGEGGFGVVWHAEQLEPLRREVALKILKAGMDSREVIARFQQERQALAMMDHPFIAQVFDAGMTGGGRPYFVMELVTGQPVTDYVAARALSVAARLRLFIQICSAIQHAHQKGIIHGDIKPSNILVAEQEGQAMPKVIDFGIAKMVEASLSHQGLDRMSRLMGTPGYMSPEQLHTGTLDMDTTSDIYSLGVVLRELLTGEPPEVISGEAQRIGTGSADLDCIVAKCLKKDRAQRYETANAVAQDIRRHLDQEPVLAHPPSTAYHLRKLVRRNKGACIAGLTVLLVLVAGTVVSTLQMQRARRAEALKGQEAERAHAAEQKALQSVAELRVANERYRRQQYAGIIRQAASLISGGQRHRVPELLWGADKSLCGWEWGWLMAQSELPLLSWQAGGEMISGLQTSPEGSRLYVGEENAQVSAWDPKTQQQIWRQKATGELKGIALSPSGALLAVVRQKSDSPGLQILDSRDGRLIFAEGTGTGSVAPGRQMVCRFMCNRKNT